jgi:cation diffusion facilitator family transporter
MELPALPPHYLLIRHTLLFILVLNWAVAIAKVVYGFATHCSSMIADGFHSLSDGASNIVGIVGIYIAAQPVDSKHPYGHRKYETFFSLLIGMLLFLVSVGMIHTAVERFTRPLLPNVTITSFIIMITTMGINSWVMSYERTRGKDLKSDILIADSQHTRADILVSLSVILTLILIRSGLAILDPIATIIIALVIAYAGFGIIKQTSVVLCDTAILDIQAITNVVSSVPGVHTCHKIRTRGRTDDIHIDMHVLVNGDMHMDEAHKVSETIEETIKKTFPGITDVIVHMEPLEDV